MGLARSAFLNEPLSLIDLIAEPIADTFRTVYTQGIVRSRRVRGVRERSGPLRTDRPQPSGGNVRRFYCHLQKSALFALVTILCSTAMRADVTGSILLWAGIHQHRFWDDEEHCHHGIQKHPDPGRVLQHLQSYKFQQSAG